MSIYRFASFRFDQQTLELTRDGEAIPLRAKPALILSLLLESPGEVVTKCTLTESVWNDRLVQDQTLFQTMSELRKALSMPRAIITIPNVGYRFALPVVNDAQLIPVSHYRRTGLFATLTLLALLAGSSMLTSPATQPVYAAPAVRAFALGMTHLNDPIQAARFFELAARENGQFLEAQLMLSEALLSQGKHDAAATAASRVLEQARVDNAGYLEASAMDLLSRLNERTGAQDNARVWARQAHDRALEGGYACTVEETSQRLFELDENLPASPIQPNPIQPDLKIAVEQPNNIAAHSGGSDDGLQPDYCDEILYSPASDDDLSWCPILPVHPLASENLLASLAAGRTSGGHA